MFVKAEIDSTAFEAFRALPEKTHPSIHFLNLLPLPVLGNLTGYRLFRLPVAAFEPRFVFLNFRPLSSLEL
jgi:hypothetical protein